MPPRGAVRTAAPVAAPEVPAARRLPVPEAGLPPELVHSILGSRTSADLAARQQAAADAAQSGVGNATIARILASAQARTADVATPLSAEPAARAPPGDTAKSADIKAAPPPIDEPAKGHGSTGGGGGGGAVAPAGGGSVAPPAGGPGAVQQAAAQTAQAMPRSPPTIVNGPTPPAKREPTPRRQIQRAAGPPPVPMATPSYADIPDPIPEATKKIEAAAARTLSDQELPAVTPSPGGHLPNLTVAPLTDQRRFLLLGEPAMAAAQLKDEDKQKIRDLRTTLLAPPEPAAPDAAPPAPPEPIKITLRPLPPLQQTVAERDLFTAALTELLLDPKADAKTILQDLKTNSKAFPGGALNDPQFQADFDPLGTSKIDEVATDIRDAAMPIADAMGVAGKTLDDAVADRKAALAKERDDALKKVQEGTDAATKTAADNSLSRKADAAQVVAGADQAKKLAAATTAPAKKPKPTFRQTADAAVARIKDKVAEAIARFTLMATERGKALDEAEKKQGAAYDDAVMADQLAAAMANKVGPDQPPLANAAEQQKARARVSKAINAAKAWADARKALIKTEVARLKAAANAERDANIKIVQDEGAAAFLALKTWGDAHDGATENWWQESAINLAAWAEKAHDTAATWAGAQNKLARLQMQRDLEDLKADAEKQLVTEGEHAADYAKMPSEQRQKFVDMAIMSDKARTGVGQGLATLLRRRVTEADRIKIDLALESEAKALPEGRWEAMQRLAQAKDPGFHADVRSDRIFKAGEDKIGTDEKAIYEALSGLTELESAAVKAHYSVNHHHSLDWALKDEMSGDELRRAQSLLNGKKGAAAAEAIHDAVWGPGTDEKQIMEALRGLTPTERADAIQYYKDQYDEDLSTRLAGDLSGTDLDQAKALLEGRRGDADAAAVQGGLTGGIFSPDRDSVTGVYDRVRQESLATAKQQGWTSQEFDAEVARRNAEIEKSFGEKFGGEANYQWGGSSQSTLQTAIFEAYPTDPTNRTLITALADNDMATADAALMQSEREGVYADDSVLKGVVRKQYDRAFESAQLDRGPELAQGVDQQMADWRKSHFDKDGKLIKPFTPREEIDQRMEFQRQSDAALQDEALDRAKGNATVLDQVLRKNHKITLDDMISQNMEWGDKRQARSELAVMRTTLPNAQATSPEALKSAKRSRRLDWAYSRVRYGIEGVGTTMEEVQGGLSGLSKEDLKYLDARWRADHNNESMREAVAGDTSGREQDDLLDTVDYGAPQTAADRMAALRRKHNRDEAGVGFLGASGSRDESARSKAALDELEALNKDLDDPNLDPRKRAFIAGELDRRIDKADAAIEAQRARVDAMADIIATVVQYVIAAIALIAAVVIEVLSAGTATPALLAIAAIVGSVAGTVSGIAIKQAVKGKAYGAEEFGTDLIVGVVDLGVTLATMGTVKGGSLISAAKAELKELGKASLKAGLKQAARRTLTTVVKDSAEVAGRASFGKRALAAAGHLAFDPKSPVRQFAKQQAWQTLVPLTANVLNERNWRNGNLIKNIVHGTADGALDNLKMGVAMAGVSHALTSGIGRVVQVEHPPKTPMEVRTAEFSAWKEQHPDRPPREFVAEYEARQSTADADAERARIETRTARKALLESLPPAERAGFADVQVIRVNDAEFKALNGGQAGDAMIWKKDGQAAVVIREGAPAGAAGALGQQMREVIAPGTAGRTVNPAEALPQRLQNRVDLKVDVVHDPELGLDGVRVVPLDPDGKIRGVLIEVGPNATALNVREHIATIDAVRKFQGTVGEIRQLAADIANAAGADIVTPRDRGRWEAMLETGKLDPIIRERLAQIAEAGGDARAALKAAREALIYAEQLRDEVARFALGAEAETRGAIAATATKRKGAVAPEERKAAAARKRAQKLQIELGERTAKQLSLQDERARLAAPVEGLVDMLQGQIDHRASLGQESPPLFEQAVAGLSSADPAERAAALKALRDWLGREPAASGKAPTLADRLRAKLSQAEAMEPNRVEREPALSTELQTVEKRLEAIKKSIAKSGYSRFAGDGRVPMHPSLPEPMAGWDYFPEPKKPLAEMTPGEVQALENNQNGFVSEMRLANRIAEAGEIVIQYGHKINEHGADHVSINPDPDHFRVTLWDSKYHTTMSTGHSPTFEIDLSIKGDRDNAVEAALRYLNDGRDQLPPDLHKKVVDALTRGDFDCVTAHTTGGPFVERTIRFAGGVEVSRD